MKPKQNQVTGDIRDQKLGNARKTVKLTYPRLSVYQITLSCSRLKPQLFWGWQNTKAPVYKNLPISPITWLEPPFKPSGVIVDKEDGVNIWPSVHAPTSFLVHSISPSHVLCDYYTHSLSIPPSGYSLVYVQKHPQQHWRSWHKGRFTWVY